MLWRTSPAVTELEELTLSWMCQLLGLPETWHGHIEDTRLDLDARGAVRGAHGAARPPRRRGLRARALVGRPRLPHPRPRDPPRSGRRRLPHARRRARPERCLRGRRHRRHDVDDVGRPRAGDRRRGRRDRARGCTSTPPTAARRASAPSCARRASSAPTRSSSTRTSGCSRRSTAPASSRRAPTTCARRSRSRPSTCAPPPRASRTSTSTGRRSGAASARSSCGP